MPQLGKKMDPRTILSPADRTDVPGVRQEETQLNSGFVRNHRMS